MWVLGCEHFTGGQVSNQPGVCQDFGQWLGAGLRMFDDSSARQKWAPDDVGSMGRLGQQP